MSEAASNTDRELWRQTPDDYYSPNIFVTRDGAIGIDVGGLVIVKRVEDWHNLARDPSTEIGPCGNDDLAEGHADE